MNFQAELGFVFLDKKGLFWDSTWHGIGFLKHCLTERTSMCRFLHLSSLLSFVCALMLFPPSSLGGDPRFNRNSLKDVESFYVSVEPLAADIEKDGLTQKSIQDDVQMQLRGAGIKTVPEKEAFDVPGNPYLYVNSHVMKLSATKEYIYSIRVSFRQNVYSVREPTIIVGAATWSSANIIGITGNLAKIPTSIKTQVATFIEAYRFVNPRD